MDSSKLAIKLFVADPAAVDTRAFLPLFHEWIQTHAIPDHLLIDVADYHHVENGPGTVLIAHEANFSMDAADGKLGLLYTRKQPLEGDISARFGAVLIAVFHAAALLEKAPVFGGKLKFQKEPMLFRINDRLAAPNTAATFAAIRADLERSVAKMFGPRVQLSHRPDPETLFEVRITSGTS